MFERSVADDLSAAGGGAHEQNDQVADAARRPADLPSLRGPRRDDVGPAPADQDRLRLTGTAAQAAKDMVNGLTMYLDEIGYQMAGRKVELIVEDSQSRPDMAISKVRKLVEHDNVHILAGLLFGHIGYAVAAKAEEFKIPLLVTVAASDDLTQRLKYHWVIRTGWTSSQPSHPFGEYVAKTLGYRKVVVIASDYAFGWEVVGGFQKTFEESGGQVVQKLWAPLRQGVPDALRQGPVLLLGDQLHQRALDQRSGQDPRRRRRGPREAAGRAAQGGAQRYAARPREARRLQQSHPERLRPQGGA